MNLIATDLTWSEARAHVLETLEQQRKDLREMSGELAVYRNQVTGKQEQDINQAHAKIRSLTERYQRARFKQWLASGAVGFLATLVFELMKLLAQHH